MCTAVRFSGKDVFFGRTLDHTCSYGEEVVILPRNFPMSLCAQQPLGRHYAVIGMAAVFEEYPLYYDGMNEVGLAMAGLNFTGNAVYKRPQNGMWNIAHYELIPWILCQCKDTKEAKILLENTCITDLQFRSDVPLAQLHWMISDQKSSIVVEQQTDGLRIHDNPADVLTNNPPFEYQMLRLRDYMHLTPEPPENKMSNSISLHPYSHGMGAMGLPGDLSSGSRFVRAAFTNAYAAKMEDDQASVRQFFHIMGTVSQTKGCCITDQGEYETTLYTSCCSANRGIYYYTTYDHPEIVAISLHEEDLTSDRMVRHPLVQPRPIRILNRRQEKD